MNDKADQGQRVMLGLLTQLEKVARSQNELASQQATMIAQNTQLVNQLAQLNAQLGTTQNRMDEIISQLGLAIQTMNEEGLPEPQHRGPGDIARQIARQVISSGFRPQPHQPPPYPQVPYRPPGRY